MIRRFLRNTDGFGLHDDLKVRPKATLTLEPVLDVLQGGVLLQGMRDWYAKNGLVADDDVNKMVFDMNDLREASDGGQGLGPNARSTYFRMYWIEHRLEVRNADDQLLHRGVGACKLLLYQNRFQ